jgi:hypothetical protein
MADDAPEDQPERWDYISRQVLASFAETYTQDKLKDTVAAGHLSAKGGVIQLMLQYGTELGGKIGTWIHDAVEKVLPPLAGFIARERSARRRGESARGRIHDSAARWRRRRTGP